METNPANAQIADDPLRTRLQYHCECIIKILAGENLTPGLDGSARRMADAMLEITAGYKINPQDLFTLFGCEDDRIPFDEMVVLPRIEFFSICEHHLLPFFGFCTVAYIPREKVIGLSKIPRIVGAFARRLQVQERLTSQIANLLWERLEPRGVGVFIEARHLCMEMRGVHQVNSPTRTSYTLGAMREDDKARNEFLTLINHR
jgi:GTP cyclohydrolase I